MRVSHPRMRRPGWIASPAVPRCRRWSTAFSRRVLVERGLLTDLARWCPKGAMAFLSSSGRKAHEQALSALVLLRMCGSQSGPSLALPGITTFTMQALPFSCVNLWIVVNTTPPLAWFAAAHPTYVKKSESLGLPDVGEAPQRRSSRLKRPEETC